MAQLTLVYGSLGFHDFGIKFCFCDGVFHVIPNWQHYEICECDFESFSKSQWEGIMTVLLKVMLHPGCCLSLLLFILSLIFYGSVHVWAMHILWEN